MVDTFRSFRDSYIDSTDVTTHSHGPKGKHAHESLAFTTWIDLSLATQQARAVGQALARKSPENRETFENNYRELERDLLDLDSRIATMVTSQPKKPLVVSHPVYDYWVRRYNLNVRSVHWEPDEAPSTAQWLELKRFLEEHPAQWMVWEGEPDSAVVKELQELGVSSLVFNPVGNVPEKGDFLSVMKENVENLRAAFP
jgi:zinc transport system substrate-binding protein